MSTSICVLILTLDLNLCCGAYRYMFHIRYAADIGMRNDVVKVSAEDLTRRLDIGALQLLSHVPEKYMNSVLGSFGRMLPFRQKDFTFPSYRKFRSKEVGLYLPDPAYDITVDKIVKVDFLSSSWS